MDGNDADALLRLIRDDDVSALTALIASGSDAGELRCEGEPALCSASRIGAQRIVQLLLSVGVDPNTRMNSGATALMQAVSGGHEQIALGLIRAGADVNACDGWGVTALICAAYSGSLPLIKLLLRSGADASISTQDGRTALDAARWRVLETRTIGSLVFRRGTSVSDDDPLVAALRGDFRTD